MSSRFVLTLCLFLSGAAGLIYQVVWVRIFALIFGNTVWAVSTVVAAFLAGLALGSFYFGRRADVAEKPLKLYIVLEILIAFTALLMTGLIYLVDEAVVSAMDIESIAAGRWQVIRFVLLFGILLVPSALMGGTLPVMIRAYVRDFASVGRGVGTLYAANTYGAVTGCFLTGFLLITTFGVFGAFSTALILNLLVAGLAWSVSGAIAGTDADQVVTKKSTPKSKKKKREEKSGRAAQKSGPLVSMQLIFMLAFVSGWCALSLETLWTRGFVVSFKATVYLFSNLLSVYLLGMAIGSHMLSRKLDKMTDPIRIFGLTQVGVGLWGFVSVWLLFGTPGWALALGSLFGDMTLTLDALVNLLLMAVVFGPATLFMGMSYPLLLKAAANSTGTLGVKSGRLYAVGTVGGVLGSLAAGFFLLPVTGLQNGLMVTGGLALLCGYTALFSASSRKGTGLAYAVSAAIALLLISTIGISGIDVGLGPVGAGEVVFAREEAMGTVKVTRARKNGPLTLNVNNYQLATSGDVAVRFGHVPLLLNPDAKDALIISLGAGITSGSVGRHNLERIECVEIVPSLIDVQPLFAKDNHNIIADRRFHLSFWDGRHYVRVSDRKYDIVISDLFQPDGAGVGSLYALEFFRDVRQKLNPGGAMAQWLPLYQLSPESFKVILRTFAHAFEYVYLFSGDINSELPTAMLYGSPEPLRIAPDRLLTALEQEGVREDMIENGDPLSFLSFYVTDREGILAMTEGSGLNSDNRPLVEFTEPKKIWNRAQNATRNFALLTENRRPFPTALIGGGDDAGLQKAINRYFDGRTSLLKGKIESAKRNYPEVLRHYKEAARKTPNEPFLGMAVFDLGYLYYHRRDYPTAAKILEWARKINPNLLEAHFYLGKAYQFMGMKEKSADAFRDLAKLSPGIAEALKTP